MRPTLWLVIASLAWAACSDSDDGGSAADAAVIDGGAAADAGADASAAADAAVSSLDELLAALRADKDAAMQAQADGAGWPAPVDGGHLYVSCEPTLTLVGGDHDSWTGTAMNADSGFSWLVLPAAAGNRYKLTDGSTWQADPWSRAYEWDEFGVMSMTAPAAAHLERYFNVGSAELPDRTVRVWVPGEPATHVLYVHDGQNLFDPNAFWGGWKLDESAPAAMMLVGIDNTAGRMDEYTHVQDDIGSGLVGGDGDAYADFVQTEVRALIAAHYGEPDRVGVMGSSLGGLISFHIALRHAGEFDFAASLSGTMGWGSIGDGVTNETMIERYAAAGHGSTALYLDSGGNGTCFDGDMDGIEDDDPSASDNYCENKQLEATLQTAGYTQDVDMWHWHEPGAAHNEAAWAARVFRPLELFAGM